MESAACVQSTWRKPQKIVSDAVSHRRFAETILEEKTSRGLGSGITWHKCICRHPVDVYLRLCLSSSVKIDAVSLCRVDQRQGVPARASARCPHVGASRQP